MKNDHQATWETYTASWKAGTKAEKERLFQQSLAQECVYRDPLAVAAGWEEISTYMLDFHQMVPGGHFVTREFKSHNNRSISQWDMCAGDGSVVGVGISYGEYNDQGKLTAMTGFYDTPQPE